jgi:hypothetical protein
MCGNQRSYRRIFRMYGRERSYESFPIAREVGEMPEGVQEASR